MNWVLRSKLMLDTYQIFESFVFEKYNITLYPKVNTFDIAKDGNETEIVRFLE